MTEDQPGDVPRFREGDAPLEALQRLMTKLPMLALEVAASVPDGLTPGALNVVLQHRRREQIRLERLCGQIEGVAEALRRARLISYDDYMRAKEAVVVVKGRGQA